MASFGTARTSGYRSKSARSGAAIGARLFSSGSQPRARKPADDSQACIRSALRRRRRMLGLTQQDAARILGMSRLTYHRIETGARRIRFAELATICTTYNCHIGELLQDGQLADAFTYAVRAIFGDALS
jgi:DNA-binding XRE family transcriptional regulator